MPFCLKGEYGGLPRAISIVFLAFLSAHTFAVSTDSETAIRTFYNGLADIIESSMESPEDCVRDAKRFVKDNREYIDSMQQSLRGRSAMMQIAYDPIKRDEIEKWTEIQEPTNTERMDMQAVSRFMDFYTEFTAKYPEHAAQIGECVSRFVPER